MRQILLSATIVMSAVTAVCAQETFGDKNVTVLETNSPDVKLVGDEATTSIYLPCIEFIGPNVVLATPNVKSIELGDESRTDMIEMDSYGIQFFNGELAGWSDGDLRFETVKNLTEFVMYQPAWCTYPLAGFWRYPSQLSFVPYGIGSGCAALERVVLPERAQCILDSFNECDMLTAIDIPSSAGYIGDSFNDCRSLRSIRVHSGLTPEISNSFINLPADAVIYVPVGFKEVYQNSEWGNLGCTIAEDAACECGYTPAQLPLRGYEILTDGRIDPESGIKLSEGKRIGNAHYHFELFDADGEPIFFNDAESEADGAQLEIYDTRDNNTVEIADYALCGITKCANRSTLVASLRLPATVERLGAFVGAYNDMIDIVNLNEGLRVIGHKALSNSRFVNATITLPSTLEYIGEAAFDNHDGLTTVRCAATTPPACGDSRVFGDKSALTLAVPTGAKKAYEDAPVWREFGVIIEDASLSVGNVIADETVAEAEYFTVDGRSVSADNIDRGLYIVRRGTEVTKVVVR